MTRAAGPGVVLGLAVLLSGRTALAQICMASSTGLSFGSYDPSAAGPSSITGRISMTCTTPVGASVTYSIQLDGGRSGSVAARTMANGANLLRYQLYTDAANSIVWGDGTGGSMTVSDGLALPIGSTSRTYTIYGLVPARQNVAAGSYLDTMTILVTY